MIVGEEFPYLSEDECVRGNRIKRSASSLSNAHVRRRGRRSARVQQLKQTEQTFSSKYGTDGATSGGRPVEWRDDDESDQYHSDSPEYGRSPRPLG